MKTHCHLCGKPYSVTPERNICDECYEANSGVRLFNGEDLKELLLRFKVGAWYGIPAAAEQIDTISDIKVSKLYIMNATEKQGELEFTVTADVTFKDGVKNEMED